MEVAERRRLSMIFAGDITVVDSSVTHHWQIAICSVWKRTRRFGLQQILQSGCMSGV